MEKNTFLNSVNELEIRVVFMEGKEITEKIKCSILPMLIRIMSRV